MRGEYPCRSAMGFRNLELPPRARRIQHATSSLRVMIGTTSACAENTCCTNLMWTNTRNYLRVRGEYMVRTDGQAARPELPPRARRILHGRGRGAYVIGTTSACAENTAPCPGRQSLWRNYLRVRGEYRSSCYAGVDELELPPRARRIHHPWRRRES